MATILYDEAAERRVIGHMLKDLLLKGIGIRSLAVSEQRITHESLDEIMGDLQRMQLEAEMSDIPLDADIKTVMDASDARVRGMMIC